MAQQRIPGLVARGVGSEHLAPDDIRGSTTILELLRMFPDGSAAQLMASIQLACAHCGGAVREPLTMAAKRHQRDARAVLEAFRALAADGPSEEQLERARERHPGLWQRR